VTDENLVTTENLVTGKPGDGRDVQRLLRASLIGYFPSVTGFVTGFDWVWVWVLPVCHWVSSVTGFSHWVYVTGFMSANKLRGSAQTAAVAASPVARKVRRFIP
jgi:hypothetical protein